MNFMNLLIPLVPEIVLLSLILSLILVGSVFESKIKKDLPNAITTITVLALVPTLGYLGQLMKEGVPSQLLLSDQFLFDHFTVVCKFFILLFFIPTLVLFRVYMAQHRLYTYEFFILLLVALLGLFVLVSCYDFMLLYVAIELQALSFYVLTALRPKNHLAVEAGLKYFIIGVLASIFLLLGIALLYGITGSTNFSALALFFANFADGAGVPVTFGILFIWLGFLIKLGATPLHAWMLDIYQGAPMPVTAFFSVLPKLGLFIVLLRLQYQVFNGFALEMYSGAVVRATSLVDCLLTSPFVLKFYPLFLCFGLLSLVVGSFGGLGQVSLKRFFAYSSLANVGFLLLTLAGGSISFATAFLFYFTVYAVLVLNFFLLVVGLQFYARVPILSLNDLNNLPLVFSIPLVFNLLALAGIPPTAGFGIKFYIYYLLVDQAQYAAAGVVLVASVVIIFFYIRIISTIFFRTSSYVPNAITRRIPLDLQALLFAFGLLGNVFLLFFLPELFVQVRGFVSLGLLGIA